MAHTDAIGALCLLLASIALWPWGSVLLWPAGAFAIVALGYFRWGSVIFRTRQGRLPLSTRVLLGPVLVGHWLSLLYYARQCRPWDEIAPGVLIGRKLSAREGRMSIDRGVTAVLDLAAEFSETRPYLGVSYRSMPILDLTAPSQEQLRSAAEFIQAESCRGMVYVHCKIGYSRSAAAVGAFLIESQRARTLMRQSRNFEPHDRRSSFGPRQKTRLESTRRPNAPLRDRPTRL